MFDIRRGDFISDDFRLMRLLVIDVLIPLRLECPIVLALDECGEVGKWILHHPGVSLIAR
jgi:hypothetical protein